MFALFWGACRPASESVEEVPIAGLALPVVGQAIAERVWQNATLRQSHVIPVEPEVLLYRPGQVRVDTKGYIYVTDYGDYKVKRFNPEGIYVNSVGAGMGDGPGEVMSIVDVQIPGDSLLFLLDDEIRRISYFSLDGAFLRSESTEESIWRYRVTPEGRSYGMTLRLPDDLLFQTRKGADVIPFGTVLEGQSSDRKGLLDGYIATYGERMIYVPRFYPVIVQYAPDGSVAYSRATPDIWSSQAPAVETQTMPGAVITRVMGPSLNRSVSVDGNMLYVHSRAEKIFTMRCV